MNLKRTQVWAICKTAQCKKSLPCPFKRSATNLWIKLCDCTIRTWQVSTAFTSILRNKKRISLYYQDTNIQIKQSAVMRIGPSSLSRHLSRLGCSLSVNMISKAQDQQVQSQTAHCLVSLCATLHEGPLFSQPI